ncbi:hypothetical protein ABT297_22870 [Dactylosporangium sp. NPDC000555]|uniref:hypothetical protein n=1 Tax=Dactylosporangium sp. NPDC000555 TaxID=3154260 RepID=UPI0033284911
MPTRLLLEGRDLEELLAQVRDEHGPDVVVISAEKVRSGGVGGLFGTQKYELTIEVPDGSKGPESVSGGTGTDAGIDAGITEPSVARGDQADTPKRSVSIEDLAAMADAAERRGENPTAASAFAELLAEAQQSPAAEAQQSPATTAQQSPSTAARQSPAAPAQERPATAADALERLLAGEAPPSVRPFRPGADRPVVSAAQAGALNAAAAAAARARAAAPAEAPGLTPAWTPAKPPTVGPRVPPAPPPSDVDPAPARTGGARPTGPPHPPPPGPIRFEPDQYRPSDSRQESPMPVEATATVEKPRTPPASERLAGAYAQLASPSSGAAAESTVAMAEKAERSDRADRPAAAAGLSRKLQSFGVPADIAVRATNGDTYGAIVEAFAALPVAEPAPDAPGETLVVVGESTHAMDVARFVAQAQRLDGDHILFAGRNAAAAGVEGRRRITGPHDARLWAKKLRKSDAPSVVAVEAALDESDWAAAIVEAVRPVAVWVVVDASRKTPDVAHHLQGLRRVNAICLRGTGSSGDPASPLSLGVPVALLDGRPSTPYQWAAMLCERLSLVGG